jgi:hypothetical protein
LLPANQGHPLPPDNHTRPLPYLRCRQISPRDPSVEYNPQHRTIRDHPHPHQSRDPRSSLNHSPPQSQFNKAVPQSPRLHRRWAANQASMRPTDCRYRIKNPREPGLHVTRQPLRCRHKQHNLHPRRGDRYPRPPKIPLLIILRSIKDPSRLASHQVRSRAPSRPPTLDA